ncbi:MAG: Crp/Fnr family transcriptional regulator [Cyanobacteria bacterium P01_A01_bin.114]
MDLSTPECLPGALRSTVVQYDLAANQRLFRPGDPARAMFIVISGRLQLVRPIFDNKLARLQAAGPGCLLGEEALFATRYTGAAIAKAPSQVLAYPKTAIMTALREHADLSQYLVTRLARKIQILETNIELRDIKVSHQRVLRYLHRIAPLASHTLNTGAVVQIDRPLKEIAEEVGFTPETLSRALIKLERMGRITRTNGDIILSDQSVA